MRGLSNQGHPDHEEHDACDGEMTEEFDHMCYLVIEASVYVVPLIRTLNATVCVGLDPLRTAHAVSSKGLAGSAVSKVMPPAAEAGRTNITCRVPALQLTADPELDDAKIVVSSEEGSGQRACSQAHFPATRGIP